MVGLSAGELALQMNGDFSWDVSSEPCLQDVSLKVPSGRLLVVVGSTGSGKTTLLSSMLGLTHQVPHFCRLVY